MKFSVGSNHSIYIIVGVLAVLALVKFLRGRNTDDAYAAASGGGGNTPGWYTLQGHHHCGVDAQGNFAAGCLCTDPKKCFGNAGTGAPYCKAHPEECAPVDKPNWCAYWYASDKQYCNLCTGPWKYTGPDGSGAKACP